MHGFFLPKASIELCRSQNLGMEPARRHEDGLSSPYQNALCSAFTRKKGRLFPWHARTPQTCHRGAAAQGQAPLALRRAFARPCTAPPFCGRPDARRVAPGKRLLAILFPKGGERTICSGISSADSPDSRKGLSAQADASRAP